MTAIDALLLAFLIILIVVILGVTFYFAYPFIQKLRMHIRSEIMIKNKQQKRVAKQFEREYVKNIVPLIQEEPLVVENFPKTLELAEMVNEEKFFNSLFFSQMVKPMIDVIARLSPTKPAEQKIVDGAQFLSGNPLVDIGAQILGNILKGGGGAKTPKPPDDYDPDQPQGKKFNPKGKPNQI